MPLPRALGMLVFALPGGIAADRFPPASVLRLVEAANALTAGTVAVLALTGGLWQLGAAAFVFDAGVGFFYRAYSASPLRILPARQLPAANGMEGTARPLLQQAAGPAVGGLLIGLVAPGAAIALITLCHAVALALLLRLHVPGQEDGPAPGRASAGLLGSVVRDIMEGVRCTVRTPWLLWTLLWAVLAVFLLLGPLEVLVPFLVRDRLGGDASVFGYLLAC